MKPKPPAPPAPPPFDEEDEDITLITPRAAPKAKGLRGPPPPPQESEDVLDELLGEPEPEPVGSARAGRAERAGGRVRWRRQGRADSRLRPPAPPDISEEDLKVLEDLERIADGAEATLHTEKVKPARMVASLIRLLIQQAHHP